MVQHNIIISQIKGILKKNPNGISITEIVGATGVHRNTVARYLDILLVSGQVEMRRFGMSKIYMLSQKVPLSAVLSISSELVIQLDSYLRIIFINEPFLDLIGGDEKDVLGKNIEYTPLAGIFEHSFPLLREKIREGFDGKEWSGEIPLDTEDIIFFCRVAPTSGDEAREIVSVILEDITSRKKAEQRREESERQYRLLAENSVDMIGRLNPDKTYLYASPAYTTTLGYPQEEILGKSFTRLIHCEDVQQIMSQVKNFTPRNPVLTFRARVRHKDGHFIWLESRIRALFDEKTQELREYYAVTRDITESKRMEEALLESEKRVRLILDSTDDLVMMQDPEGRYLYFNSSSQYGVSREEMIGLTPYDLFDSVSAELLTERVKKVVNTGQSIRTDTPLVWKGQTLWFSDSLSPVKDKNGTVTAVVTISQNITERKQAEMALRKSEEEYRAIFDNAIVGFFRTTPEGILLKVNRSFARMYGYDNPDEIISQTKAGILQYADPDDRKEILRELNETGTLQPREVRVRHRDGHVFWALIAARSVKGAEGTILYFDGTHIDITAQKKIEDRLREREDQTSGPV